MQKPSFALLVLPVLAAVAHAQTGRSLQLGTAPGLGVTSTYVASYPSSAAGRLGFFHLTMPHLGAVPLSLPGFTSNGLVRIDLDRILLSQFFVQTTAGTQNLSVSIPLDAVFSGFEFDVQTVDVDFAAAQLAWADNDLELAIGQGVVGPGLDLLAIEPGSFSMGSDSGAAVERPVHTVTITRPFWIGRCEVTQAVYQAVTGTNPSSVVDPNLPVDTVSWNAAVAFCAALTAQEFAAGRLPPGYVYRLPTEAEWEYCCRGGTTTQWNLGDVLGCADANVAAAASGGPCVGRSTLSGSYPGNPWGLSDAHGNLHEWCLDAWNLTPNYPAGAVSDPFVGIGPVRIVRGGSWLTGVSDTRSATRFGTGPAFANALYGFRIVCAPTVP